MMTLQSIECGGCTTSFQNEPALIFYQEIFRTLHRNRFPPLHGLAVLIMEEVESSQLFSRNVISDLK